MRVSLIKKSRTTLSHRRNDRNDCATIGYFNYVSVRYADSLFSSGQHCGVRMRSDCLLCVDGRVAYSTSAYVMTPRNGRPPNASTRSRSPSAQSRCFNLPIALDRLGRQTRGIRLPCPGLGHQVIRRQLPRRRAGQGADVAHCRRGVRASTRKWPGRHDDFIAVRTRLLDGFHGMDPGAHLAPALRRRPIGLDGGRSRRWPASRTTRRHCGLC